jgi:hypothetical protein
VRRVCKYSIVYRVAVRTQFSVANLCLKLPSSIPRVYKLVRNGKVVSGWLQRCGGVKCTALLINYIDPVILMMLITRSDNSKRVSL